MKLNIKTIKGETFQVEAEKTDSITIVKQKIFDAKGIEASTQKLIFKGAQLSDEKSLSDCGVNDGDMMVVMSVKKPAGSVQPQPQISQPQPQPQQQPIREPAIGGSAVAGSQPQQPGAGGAGGLGVNMLTPEQFNKTVDDIVNMGFSRQEATVALQAAYNNPDRAIDYLINGMPQNPAVFGGEEDEGSDSGSPELNYPEGGGVPSNQMLSQLRAAIQQDPNVLQQVLSQLATTNPQLYQAIQANPGAFLNLLNGEADGGDDEGDDLGGYYEEGEAQPPQINAQDNAAIERLCGLGFDRAQALEAFVACEKDENMAANYLLECCLRGEGAQNNQNPPGANNNNNQQGNK